MTSENSIFFPTTYQNSRAYFRDQLVNIKVDWPSARLDKFAISETEDLTIDCLTAEPIEKKEKMILITTGLHGVEGFVGAAMLDLFIREYLPHLDPKTTGLMFIHALNPWGMANFRRFNPSNVDLNRNFMVTPDEFDVVFNRSYLKLDGVLNPSRPLNPGWMEDPLFYLNVVKNIITFGIKSLREAVMLGQQSNPLGLYFSGREYQLETRYVMGLIGNAFSNYNKFLILDMHTGYGPSDQMSLVVPSDELRSSAKLMEDFNYPLVNKADPEEFYSMQGDMIDWIYQYQSSSYKDTELFGAACEFGTVGSGTINETISLRTMIYINQADQQGTRSLKVERRIHDEFVEMYYPSAVKWREKALADCREAFTGILSAEGYF